MTDGKPVQLGPFCSSWELCDAFWRHHLRRFITILRTAVYVVRYDQYNISKIHNKKENHTHTNAA